MRINSIKATLMELTPEIADYARKRIIMLDKVVSRDDESARASIEVGKTTEHHKEGNLFFAEFNVHIAGKDFRVVAEKDELFAAIDEAKDGIIREVTQYKDKRRTLIRRGGAAIKNILRGVGDWGGRVGGGIGRGIRGVGGRIRRFRFRRQK